MKATDRSHYIGSSDAMRIMTGDWLTLYNEKLGLAEPVDLSDNFKVQLGIFTERFHLDWLERIGKIENRDGGVSVHPDHEMILSHADSWDAIRSIPVEVKHSSGNANAVDKARFYMPQLQHHMACYRTDACWFSVIAGNDDPELVLVDRDDAYIADLIEIERSFWWHCTKKIPPEPGKADMRRGMDRAHTVKVNGLKPYDMRENNEWGSLAIDVIENKAAADTFDRAKKAIKDLVPDDAESASGNGLTFKRDKRGALRMSID